MCRQAAKLQLARLIVIGGSLSCDVVEVEVAECCCLANIGVR